MEDDVVMGTDPTGRYIKFASELGRGAYKIVYKSIDRDLGIEVAWNEIRVDRGADFDKLWKEITILQQLSHPNVIVCHDAWLDEKNLYVAFITECMTSGTLRSFMKKAKNVKLRVIKNWCIQILEGLNYLHTREPPIVHRDIKCDNIFINGNSGQVKIGDLGLATNIVNYASATKLSIIGTPEFMAPEYYDEEYDVKVDIWAFGMCVLEMATHEYPYSECSAPAQIFKKVMNGERPQSLERVQDKDVYNFIMECLEPEPEKRKSAAELLAHPFLQNVNDEINNRTILPENDSLSPSSSSNSINTKEKSTTYGETKPSGFGESKPSGFGESKPSGFGGSMPSGFGENKPSGFGENSSDHNNLSKSDLIIDPLEISDHLTDSRIESTPSPPPKSDEDLLTPPQSPPLSKDVQALTSGPKTMLPSPRFHQAPVISEIERGHTLAPMYSSKIKPIHIDSSGDKKEAGMDIVVLASESKKSSMNMIKLSLNLDIDGRNSTIEFDYDINRDTPEEVSKEMVSEFELCPSNEDTIAKYIKEKLFEYRQHVNPNLSFKSPLSRSASVQPLSVARDNPKPATRSQDMSEIVKKHTVRHSVNLEDDDDDMSDDLSDSEDAHDIESSDDEMDIKLIAQTNNESCDAALKAFEHDMKVLSESQSNDQLKTSERVIPGARSEIDHGRNVINNF